MRELIPRRTNRPGPCISRPKLPRRYARVPTSSFSRLDRRTIGVSRSSNHSRISIRARGCALGSRQAHPSGGLARAGVDASLLGAFFVARCLLRTRSRSLNPPRGDCVSRPSPVAPFPGVCTASPAASLWRRGNCAFLAALARSSPRGATRPRLRTRVLRDWRCPRPPRACHHAFSAIPARGPPVALITASAPGQRATSWLARQCSFYPIRPVLTRPSRPPSAARRASPRSRPGRLLLVFWVALRAPPEDSGGRLSLPRRRNFRHRTPSLDCEPLSLRRRASTRRSATFPFIEDHHRPTRVNPKPNHALRINREPQPRRRRLSRPSAQSRRVGARSSRRRRAPRSTSGEPRRVRGRQAPASHRRRRAPQYARHAPSRSRRDFSRPLVALGGWRRRRRRRAGECLQGAPSRVAALPSVLAARRGRREPRRAIFDGIAAHGRPGRRGARHHVRVRSRPGVHLARPRGWDDDGGDCVSAAVAGDDARRVRGPRGAPCRATHRARARSRETGGAREPGVSDGEGKRRSLHLSRRRQAEQVLHRHVHQGARLAPPRHVHLLVSHRGRPRGVQGDASQDVGGRGGIRRGAHGRSSRSRRGALLRRQRTHGDSPVGNRRRDDAAAPGDSRVSRDRALRRPVLASRGVRRLPRAR